MGSTRAADNLAAVSKVSQSMIFDYDFPSLPHSDANPTIRVCQR